MYDNIREELARQHLEDMLRAAARERRTPRRRRHLRTPEGRSDDSVC
jgi:hypothetical protein